MRTVHDWPEPEWATSQTHLTLVPGLGPQVRSPACSTVAIRHADRRAIRGQSVRLSANSPHNSPRPGRRSTDGQTISTAGLTGWKPVSDPVLGQTQPNRRYLLAATSVGMVNDVLPENLLPAPHGTIFDRLDEHHIPWRNPVAELLFQLPADQLPVPRRRHR